jgi:hypothetical protein
MRSPPAAAIKDTVVFVVATIAMPGFRSGKTDHHVQRLAICRPLDHPNREPVHLPVDSTGLKLRSLSPAPE